MPDRIRLLPDVVANQIAAGEVVNRPASVVKEMMENAVDAGAHTVTVNYRDGGRELIQVVDDGSGMSPIDARLAFDRHATSKIAEVDDLYRLSTFGFRGEALASIAAVAQVELRCRMAEDEIGTLTRIAGGRFEGQEPVMCPVGSQFFVRNLFYNVPARRRFLEKSSTSAGQIRAEFQRVALSHPETAFRLLQNDTPQYTLQPDTLRGRIIDVAGRSIRTNLVEVAAETTIVRIEGFVGRPAAARKSGSDQYLFVNGRYFRSPYLYRAIMRAYEKLIPAQSQPSWFLYLTIDPERIDVNVHPQKTEVKFADAEAVWQILSAAIREALVRTGAVPLMEFGDGGGIDIPPLREGAVYPEPGISVRHDYNPFNEGYASPTPAPSPTRKGDFTDFDRTYPTAPPAGEPSDAYRFEEGGEESLVFIPAEEVRQGRLAALDEQGGTERFAQVVPLPEGYAAAVYRGELVLVDLRRAQERVAYEELLNRLGEGRTVGQRLLFPEELLLSSDEMALVAAHRADLEHLGFELEPGDDCLLRVHGVPAGMEADAVDELLAELLDALSDPGAVADTVRRERLAGILARGAAPAIARAYAREEAEAILERLAATRRSAFTPAGKPVYCILSVGEIRNRLQGS